MNKATTRLPVTGSEARNLTEDPIFDHLNLWFGIALMPLLIWMVADAWVHSDRLEALRGELHAPRAETAAEASAADAAERLADIAVKPGLWIYKKEVRSVSVRFDLLLREDRTFVAT